MKFHLNSTSLSGVNNLLQYKKCNGEKKQMGQSAITPKILMPELWILCMTLAHFKLYPYSIASVVLELFQNEKCDGMRDVRTDRRTDRQTDDGELIPKCHLCLQQVTQKSSVK